MAARHFSSLLGLVDDVEEAAFSEGGKQRVVMFELISYGMTETRISALGGHGF